MTILIVYNAEEGVFNAIFDSVHKLISPQTYECSLCAITHGSFGMLRSWKHYLEALEYPVAFYHRAQFREKYGRTDIPWPAILVDRDGKLDILLTASEINECGDLHELMERVDGTIRRLVP